MSDPELLRQYVENGSNDAFGELVRRHLPVVLAAATRKLGGDAHRAQEAAQDAFVAMARDARRLTSHPSIGGWLYVTVCHLAVNAVRAKQRRQVNEERSSAMNSVESEGADRLCWEDLRPVVDEALLRLSKRERDAIVLRFFHGMAFEAIGTALQVTEGGARMRVERGLEKLRSTMARRGITSTTAALSGVLAANAHAAPLSTEVTRAVTSAALTKASALGTGGVAGFLGFMSASKLTSITALAALVLLLTGGYRAHRAAIDDEEVARIEGDNARLAASLRRVAPARAAATPAIVAPKASVASPEDEVALMEKYREASSRVHEQMLARDPEYQRTFMWMTELQAQLRFQPFYDSLGLTSEQRDRAQAVLAEFGWNHFDIVATATAAGIDPDRSEIQALFAEAKRAEQAGLAKVLGEEGLAKFNEYDRLSSLRAEVADELARYLYDSATPLRREQADALTQALATTSPVYAESESPSVHDIDWDAAMPKAQRILSPEQYAMLERVRASGEYSRALANALGAAKAALEESSGKTKP